MFYFNCSFVVNDGFFRLTHIVFGIGQTDKRLELLRVVNKRLLKILGRNVGIAGFKKKISHCDHAGDVFGIDLEAFLEEFSCFLEIVQLQINDTDLAISFIMIRIILIDILVMLQCILILVILVEDLSQTKMSRDALRLQLDAMSEVLLCFSEVTLIGELCSQVDARTKVRLVDEKALLEVVDCLFYFFFLFELATEVEVALAGVLGRHCCKLV